MRAPAVERFEAKVMPEPNSGCWLWTGAVCKDGYGQFRWGPGSTFMGKAHRFAWEHYRGPIPEGMIIDHKCRNPFCVNPDHLEPVTYAENANRGLNGVLKTHCKHGHPLTGDNLYYHGQRRCRKCRQASWLKTPARNRRIQGRV